jgi:16S rRNA (uracil1498-N3)-methyltransferase
MSHRSYSASRRLAVGLRPRRDTHARNAAVRMQRLRPRCLVTCSVAQQPRLFASPLPAAGARFSLSAEESRHATRALRLREGDAVELFDGDGGCVAARIVAVDSRGAAAVEACGAAVRVPWTGPRWDVAVACVGLTQRADWTVEKCAELGVASLIPLLTERSAATKQQRAEQTKEWQRWERLSLAASKQCLRLHSLKVAPATRLSELLPVVRASQLALVALQGGAPLGDVLTNNRAAAQTGGLLIIGPPVRALTAPAQCCAARSCCTLTNVCRLCPCGRGTSRTQRRRRCGKRALWVWGWGSCDCGRRRRPSRCLPCACCLNRKVVCCAALRMLILHGRPTHCCGERKALA